MVQKSKVDKKNIENFSRIAIKAALLAGVEIMEIYNNGEFAIEYKSDNSPITIADKRAHEIITSELLETLLPVLSEEGVDIPYHTREKWNLFWLIDPIDGTQEFIKQNGEFTVNIALIEHSKPVFGVIYSPVSGKIYFGSGNSAYSYQNIKNDTSDIGEILNEIETFKFQLPLQKKRDHFTIAASRSNMNKETEKYINQLNAQYQNVETVSVGSSLKFCIIAEGVADIYPRFSTTMEWDTAAGQAIVEAAGGQVIHATTNEKLEYNKQNLQNPWFIVKNNLID